MRRTEAMRYMTWLLVGVVGALVIAVGTGQAQTFDSGSTGADGAFSPTSTTTLTLPASGTFNFTTVNVPVGVTVRFTRNSTNTPVTILASGNVTIAGTIDVSGAAGSAATISGIYLGANAGISGP